MERQYILKDDVINYLKKYKITNRKIANRIGVTEGYVSQIKNKKHTNISKLMAYAFAKAINSEFEIENIFNIL